MSKRAEEMSVEELLAALPADWHARKDPDGSIVLESQPFKPWPRSVRAAYATMKLRERTERRIRRTAELTAGGKSAREIGQIIASEEGSDDGFPVTTVRGWRRRARQVGSGD